MCVCVWGGGGANVPTYSTSHQNWQSFATVDTNLINKYVYDINDMVNEIHWLSINWPLYVLKRSV